MSADNVADRLESAIKNSAGVKNDELLKRLISLCEEALPGDRARVVETLRRWIEDAQRPFAVSLQALAVTEKLLLTELLPSLPILQERTLRQSQDASGDTRSRAIAAHTLYALEIVTWKLTAGRTPPRGSPEPKQGHAVFERIKKEIIAARDCGEVTVEYRPRFYSGAPAIAEVLELCGKVGFELAAAMHCRRIDREKARSTLRAVLERDLAYRAKIMDPRLAERLSDEYLGLFGADAYFFTNTDAEIEGAWSGLTEATIDTGILAVDQLRVGCAWFEDED
jgi:hypothetical protein